jgi:hypothetical protein
VLREATHWDEVVRGLGYEHLVRHDLRHTGLTWMADAGVPVHGLQKIAGHGVATDHAVIPAPGSVVDRGGRAGAQRPPHGAPVPGWSPATRGVIMARSI